MGSSDTVDEDSKLAGKKAQAKQLFSPFSKMAGQDTTRPEPTANAAGEGELSSSDIVIDALALVSKIRVLTSDNRHLRQQLQLLQGNHEALQVSTLTVVDLSRFDTGLVAQIASFVGTSHELLNLALTCKAFGWWRQPTSGQDLSLSLVEEVARQTVKPGVLDGVRITLPQYVRGGTTWLSILNKSENPLKFDTLAGRSIEYQNGKRNSVCGKYTYNHCQGTAVANNFVMVSGMHFAEFQISGGLCIGVVRPMPNLNMLSKDNDDEDVHFNFFTDSFVDR